MATEILRPNGAGDETGIQNVTGAATHWQAVNEAVADDATTTVHHDTDSTSGRDLYTIQSSSVGAGTINSVAITIRFEGTTGWSKTAIKTHATVYESAQLSSGADDTWSTQTVTYTTNPNTGAAWTWSEIAALQIGARNFRDPVQQGRVTQIYATIDYTAASGPTNLKSLDTNVKSNIKSISGDLIANVKSYSGNS